MKYKTIDPRIANEITAKNHTGLIASANVVTTGKHNGSKRKKTLVYLSHRLNNQVSSFMSSHHA